MPTYHKPTVLSGGVYDVKIVAAEERKSKSGNEMIVVKAETQFNGKTYYIRDYLLTGDPDRKLQSFLRAIGEELEDGAEFQPDDYVGRSARAVVGVQEFDGGPQNKIKKWLPPAKAEAAADSNPGGG
jgi:hypothetical protein